LAQSGLKLSLPALGAGAAPIHYAVDQGLFQQEGIDLEIVWLEGGPACASSLLAGETDLNCALGPLIRMAMREGSRGFKAISGLRKKIAFSIVGRPDLTSINDLRGKSIESPHSDWSGGTYFKYVLRQLQLEGQIQLEYNYVTQEQRLEGLLKGEFDAGLLAGEKIIIAQEHGFKVLVDFDEAIPNVCSSVMSSTPEIIRDRREDLKKVIRAIKSAIQKIQNDREECIKFFVKRFAMDPKTATSLYELHAVNWSVNLSIDSIQKDIDISHTVHGLPWVSAKEIVDLTLLREVLES